MVAQQCIEKINSLFGDEAPSKTMVYKWFTELKGGRPTFNDDLREGYPWTSVVAKSIDTVPPIILED